MEKASSPIPKAAQEGSTDAIAPTPDVDTKTLMLATVLRAEAGTAGARVAATLESPGGAAALSSLVLRGGGVTAAGAASLAAAIAAHPPLGRVTTLSISYCPVGDVGTAALVERALPQLPALREVGMVGCGIGDTGGEALLVWASEAQSRLTMLCVEGNDFSASLKARFRQLDIAILVV